MLEHVLRDREINDYIRRNARSEGGVREDFSKGYCFYDTTVSFNHITYVRYNDGRVFIRRGREFHTRDFIAFLRMVDNFHLYNF